MTTKHHHNDISSIYERPPWNSDTIIEGNGSSADDPPKGNNDSTAEGNNSYTDGRPPWNSDTAIEGNDIDESAMHHSDSKEDLQTYFEIKGGSNHDPLNLLHNKMHNKEEKLFPLQQHECHSPDAQRRKIEISSTGDKIPILHSPLESKEGNDFWTHPYGSPKDLPPRTSLGSGQEHLPDGTGIDVHHHHKQSDPVELHEPVTARHSHTKSGHTSQHFGNSEDVPALESFADGLDPIDEAEVKVLHVHRQTDPVEVLESHHTKSVHQSHHSHEENNDHHGKRQKLNESN